MNVPISAILVVLAIGSMLLLPLLLLPTLRLGATVVIKRRWFGWPLLLLFGLLFWPVDPGQAYAGHVELGIHRVARVVVFIGLFFALLPRVVRDPIWLKRSILNWYLVYIVICGMSATYAPDWREAAWKSFELLVVLMFASVVRTSVRQHRLMLDEILASYILLIFVSVLFALVGWITFPEYGYGQWTFQDSDVLSRSLGGIVPRVAPNSLGQFAAMVLFAGMAGWVMRGKLGKENLVFIAVGSVVLVMAYARTSIGAVGLLILFLLVMSRRATGKFLLLPLISIGILSSGILFEYYLRGQDIEQFMTLSGRTNMWQIAWESIRVHPWFGTGLGSHKSLDISLGMEYSSLDSTYIEAIVGVGVIGAAFLIIFVLTVLKRMMVLSVHFMRRNFGSSLSLVIAGGFVFLMFIRSLAGPSFQVLHWNIVMFLTIAVAVLEAGLPKMVQGQRIFTRAVDKAK